MRNLRGDAAALSPDARKNIRTQIHGKLPLLQNADYTNKYEYANDVTAYLYVIIADRRLDAVAWYSTKV